MNETRLNGFPALRTSFVNKLAEFLRAIDHMDKVIMMPNRLCDMDTDENDNRDTGTDAPLGSKDIHHCYSMLKELRGQLLLGNNEEVSRPGEDDIGLFDSYKRHQQGFMDSIQQLTEAAIFITHRYKKEFGDFDSDIAPKLFAV
ncbi:mid1-interacting protein 1A-like [Ptychodera flava]|uniref:mid1-interacting protein 1A-like n=1 Tax=Ptychodera flava TaxID=63121 RepID=UPI00396A27A3